MSSLTALAPLIKLLIKVLGIPAVILWEFQATAPNKLNKLQLVGSYLIGVAFYLCFKINLSRWRISRRAKAHGATVIPRVRGRWIFNIDILKEIQAKFFVTPPGTAMLDFQERTGSKTLDTAVLGGSLIMTSDHLIAKHILTGNSFNNYGKGDFFKQMMFEMFGTGIFNSDGDRWKAHRNMARPYFAMEKISDFETFNRHTTHLLEIIDKRSSSPGTSSAHSNGAVEIQDLFGRFTLDSATEFLMNGAVDSLSEVGTAGKTEGPSTTFLNSFGSIQKHSARRGRLGPIWPLLELGSNTNPANLKIINVLIDKLVDKALAKSEGADADEKEASSLIDSLVQRTRDPKVIKDQVINILLAARDTTMSALTFSIYNLARHPIILAKLRAEIINAIGKDTVPTYEDARSMVYLRAFINEVLRMYPPVPFNSRQSINDDVCVDNEGVRHFIPGGTRVRFTQPRAQKLYLANSSALQFNYSLYLMQRRTDLWGDDALTFDPNRWVDERKEIQKTNPFIFQPFSAGPRICLGQNFAYNEISFALIRILQQYDGIEIAYDVQPPESVLENKELLPFIQIILFITGGLWVRMQKAE
ncbi:hypothetical protein P7C70_g7871, partial [Phenoliferia sp. Uapishka_3]